ncbi:MAG: helix-turn-helix domain-containing protein [Caldisericaceae bacterium]
MDKQLFETLLNKTEGEELDFKSEQYKLDTEEQKAEFIKDILAFANAWKASDAYIICGIIEKDGRVNQIIGIGTDHHLEDSHLQQLVYSKTNRPPRFRYEPYTYEGKELGIIIIEKQQDRPIYLIKNCGKLIAEAVYIRHGSSTDIASPDEIKKMGEYPPVFELPVLDILLKNKEDGTIFEKEVLLKSTVLNFINKPANVEGSQEITTKEELNQISSLNQTVNALAEKMKENWEELNKSLKEIRYNPDYTKELKEYLQCKKMFTPISFIMQNTGASTAYDVKTEVRISKKQVEDILELRVFLHYELIKPPLENRFDFSKKLTPILKEREKDIISKETEDEYIFEIKFVKIQPKDTLESKGFLYIGAFTSLEFEMRTKTFADNLPNPIEKTFNFKIEVKEENYIIEAKDEDKKTQ